MSTYAGNIVAAAIRDEIAEQTYTILDPNDPNWLTIDGEVRLDEIGNAAVKALTDAGFKVTR